jgi:hypothetical protein
MHASGATAGMPKYCGHLTKKWRKFVKNTSSCLMSLRLTDGKNTLAEANASKMPHKWLNV